MKHTITIQSISDIITNSSSETFCRITSDNYLMPIYDLLTEIFPDQEYEVTPVVDIRKKDGDYICEEDIEEADKKDLCIEIDVPYCMNSVCNLLEYGLSPTLKDAFPDADFKIEIL